MLRASGAFKAVFWYSIRSTVRFHVILLLLLSESTNTEAKTLEGLIVDWNCTHSQRVELVRRYNKELQDRLQNGEVSHETALRGILPEPKVVPAPSEAWVRHWKDVWGWSMVTRGGDEQQWLPWNHPDMVQSREDTRALISKENVHKFLILNYDQVWRTAWQMSRHKLAFKPRASKGLRGKKKACGPKESKKVHAVRGSRRSLTAAWIQGLLHSRSVFTTCPQTCTCWVYCTVLYLRCENASTV